MNTLTDLAAQSGITFEWNVAHSGVKTAVITPSDLRRFAEAIVRDCAGIYIIIDNGNSYMGTDNYLEALWKNFGVE